MTTAKRRWPKGPSLLMGMKIGDVGGLVCFEDEREYGKTPEVIVGLI